MARKSLVDAKPGTAMSRQTITFKKKVSKVQLAKEKLLEYDVIDTNNVVDESIVLFAVEFAQLKGGLQQIPKNSMDFCKSFHVPIDKLDLQ